jgi:hypothetical protein
MKITESELESKGFELFESFGAPEELLLERANS